MTFAVVSGAGERPRRPAASIRDRGLGMGASRALRLFWFARPAALLGRAISTPSACLARQRRSRVSEPKGPSLTAAWYSALTSFLL
jgi:hypothetical protein